MRLQLSIWAEGLCKQGLRQPDPFATVTILNNEKGKKPVLLGKTEVIANTVDPDWTKIFFIDNYNIGSEIRFVISIYNSDKRNKEQIMGSAVFEVGQILGSKGSILGKELKDGGVVVANLESAQDVGFLRFQLRAVDLINTEGIMRKPDPFFELQRLRSSATTGTRVWDTVFRSSPIRDTLEPAWGESFIQLSALCGTCRDQQFRLAIFDFEGSGRHVFMGDLKLTIDEMAHAVAKDGVDDNVSHDKALQLKRQGEDAGYLIVVVADVTESEREASLVLDLDDQEPVTVSEEISEASPSEEFTLEKGDLYSIAPTFANYVSGGCELHAMVAIDATSSNGDPRQSNSLHRFDNKTNNDYKMALSTICCSLAKFDSDQKYPLYGFGAKKEGRVNHCFPLVEGTYVAGVPGILDAYDKAFNSGITMSTPRDFSEVIQTCTQASLTELENGHAYTILLVFTNGVPADIPGCVNALREADDAPLSIVIVGIGEGNFSAMKRIKDEANQGRDKLRFVLYSDNKAFSAEALDHIPEQLESYFKQREIYPNPEVATDEITVEPYNEATDAEVPTQINAQNGPVVADNSNNELNENAASSTNHQPPGKSGGSMEFIMKQGQTILKKHKKQIGQMKRKFNNEIRKEIKKKFPKAKFLL
ncbi:hypothetical protein ACA910_011806 [Epithemia clementina (nom. ined.)]